MVLDDVLLQNFSLMTLYTHTENQRSFSGHDTHHWEKSRVGQLICLICIEGMNFLLFFVPFSHFGKITMPVNNVICPSNFALFFCMVEYECLGIN